MKILLSMLFVIAVASPVQAQTQFIKYKNYLIPIKTGCAKPKIIITTDIREGGVDNNNNLLEEDDTQSLVHYLVSSYRFDTRGLISTPGGGTGSVATINRVVNAYAKDRNELITLNPGADSDPATAYSTKSYLDSITKPGINLSGTQSIPTYNSGVHFGAKLIRDEVSKIVNGGECGPVYILVWGTLSEVAIALNGTDSTEALSNQQVARNIRLHVIGSTNIGKLPGGNGTLTKAYELIQNKYLGSPLNNNDDLWMIESNYTFGGFEGASGAGSSSIGNIFLNHPNIKNQSCLANLLAATNTGLVRLKMGDSPSVFYMMNGDIDNPETSSWGGRFRRPKSGKPYFVDLDNGPAARATIGLVSSDFASNSNTIYGAWYRDLVGVGGCDSN